MSRRQERRKERQQRALKAEMLKRNPAVPEANSSGWRLDRERWAALAGAILLTAGLPIAIDQGYFHYNVYALPALGLVAALLYLGFLLTTEFSKRCIRRLYAGCGKVGGIARSGVFVSLCVLVGGALGCSEIMAIAKSREHIAEILLKEQQSAVTVPLDKHADSKSEVFLDWRDHPCERMILHVIDNSQRMTQILGVC
jgi:hypothetical protein